MFHKQRSHIDGSCDMLEQQDHDKAKNQGVELVEKNLATWKREFPPLFISDNLPVELKQALLNLLHEFKDVFSWTYAWIPGLYSQLVTYKMNIKEGTKSATSSHEF